MGADRRAPTISRERILSAFPAIGRCFVSPQYIASKIGCRPETTRKRLAEMVASGEIERASGPVFGTASNPYTYRRKAAE